MDSLSHQWSGPTPAEPDDPAECDDAWIRGDHAVRVVPAKRDESDSARAKFPQIARSPCFRRAAAGWLKPRTRIGLASTGSARTGQIRDQARSRRRSYRDHYNDELAALVQQRGLAVTRSSG